MERNSQPTFTKSHLVSLYTAFMYEMFFLQYEWNHC